MTKKRLILVFSIVILAIATCIAFTLIVSSKDLLMSQFELRDKDIIRISVIPGHAVPTAYRLSGNAFDKYCDAFRKIKIRPIAEKEITDGNIGFGYANNILLYSFSDGTLMQLCLSGDTPKLIGVSYGRLDMERYIVLNNSIITYDNLDEILNTAQEAA